MAKTTRTTIDPVDKHVGQRLRLRRTLLGISQEKLGQSLGLTFQQIQKYERGSNRVSASRLYQLGKLLDVPVQFFFADFDQQSAGTDYAIPAKQVAGQLAERSDGYGTSTESHSIGSIESDDPMTRKETLQLVRNYYRLDETSRENFFRLFESLAGSAKTSKPVGPKLGQVAAKVVELVDG